MASRPFINDESVQDVHPKAEAAAIDRYQLNVAAATMADVVSSAGGWLCDRAWAGWEVNVLIADHHDPRPLKILGATALDLDAEFGSVMTHASPGGALAVSADLLRTDGRVRTDILRVLKRGRTEVTVWGESWPAEFGRQVDPVEHRLSAAARAFKAHALAGVAAPEGSPGSTETLFRIGTGSFRPLYSV
ncbi:MAG TPA: hypothetical protein VHU62_08750 [Mycobacterium sp.]|jgi:hypothetical protein|nr:hypothetical protein [Mycobacterium sp.]